MDSDSDSSIVEIIDEDEGPRGDRRDVVEEAPGDNVAEDEVTGADDNTTTRKRKKPSPVWKYAKKVKKDGNDGGECGICGVFKPSKYGTTSNMINHILNVHKGSDEAKQLKVEVEEKAKNDAETKKKSEEKKKNQGSILQFIKRSGKINKSKKEAIDDAFVEFVVCRNESFAVADDHFFRKLMFEAEPDWIAPSASTLIRKFDTKAVKIKEKLKSELLEDIKKAGNKTISITVDGGTSKDRKKTKKNAVTIHRTTKDFKLKSDTLAVVKVNGSQNADDVRKQVKEVLKTYGYQEDWVLNMTTDGAAVMVSARARYRHPQVLYCILFYN
jgi:hypothetical protein